MRGKLSFVRANMSLKEWILSLYVEPSDQCLLISVVSCRFERRSNILKTVNSKRPSLVSIHRVISCLDWPDRIQHGTRKRIMRCATAWSDCQFSYKSGMENMSSCIQNLVSLVFQPTGTCYFNMPLSLLFRLVRSHKAECSLSNVAIHCSAFQHRNYKNPGCRKF